MKDLNLITRFKHNDLMYDCWYEGNVEQAWFEDEDFNCDTVKARTIFGQAVIDWINRELNTDFKLNKMYFPREYNFETDAIDVEFSEDDAHKLKIYIFNDKHLIEKFNDLAKSVTTLSSGYIPFHTYSDLIERQDLYIGLMLEIFMEYNIGTWESYYDVQCVYDDLAQAIL